MTISCFVACHAECATKHCGTKNYSFRYLSIQRRMWLRAADAPVGAALAGEAMGLAREEHQLSIHPHLTQSNIELFALFLWRAEVGFAVNDQRRRLGVADIFDRRNLPVGLKVFIWGGLDADKVTPTIVEVGPSPTC